MTISPPPLGGEHDGQPVTGIAAFFDLDKTIIAKASMAAFRGPLYEQGILNRRTITKSLFAQLIYFHLGVDDKRALRLRNAVLRLVVGWDQQAVERLVCETLEAIVEPIIYAEAIDLLEWHRAAGHRIVIVSASPREIVDPLSKHLGAETCIASVAEVDDGGKYTGSMSFYAHGTEKADALQSWASDEHVDLARSYAYSDSISDLPMLNLVGLPVVVNGNRELSRYARDHGWATRTFEHPVALRHRVRGRAKELTTRSTATVAVAIAAALVALITRSWYLPRHRHVMTTVERPSDQLFHLPDQ